VPLHASYVADLSAFLPARPTPAQRLLVDQLRDGPGSRLLLIALEGGDVETRASCRRPSHARCEETTSSRASATAMPLQRIGTVNFCSRIVPAEPQVTHEHFTAEGLKKPCRKPSRTRIARGLALQSLVARDPTVRCSGNGSAVRHAGAAFRGGVWSSADGSRSLLIAETAASGSDTDARSTHWRPCVLRSPPRCPRPVAAR